jgi:prolyl oligopeptidase
LIYFVTQVISLVVIHRLALCQRSDDYLNRATHIQISTEFKKGEFAMTKFFKPCCFSAIFFIGSWAGDSYTQSSDHSGKLVYPQAKPMEQSDNYHGIRVEDPFRWLENMESTETRRWVNAQDELTKNFLNGVPARSTIHKRISALWNFDLYSIPTKADNRYFYTKTAAGKSRSVLYVQEKLDSLPRIIDPLARFGDQEVTLAGYWPSLDGRLLAYATAKGQSRWRRLKIVDIESGRDYTDEIIGLHNLSGGIAWTKDGKGFFYTRFDLPKEGSEQKAAIESSKIYYHRLGTAQSEDQLIFAKPGQTQWLFTLQTTIDGRYLIITAREGSNSANKIYFKNLLSPHGNVGSLDKVDAAYTILGNQGSYFQFYTDFAAPAGRVVAFDITKPQPKYWTEVIPQADETIAGGSLVGGNALGLFGNQFVIMYIKDGRPLVKVFSLQGRFQYEVDLPGAGSIWGGFSGTQNDYEVFYQFLGIADPSSIHCLNLKTRKRTIFRRSQLNFDPDHFVAAQIFYQSKDGTRVPMFIAHKKGLQMDGKNPAFMYGYGAFGWSSFMWYQPHVLLWMEMGGVYALPGLRGGGEYGEAWHQAGMKRNKQNAIDDYLAAAEWLIANKYTSPSKLVANGGSASGSMAGAAMLRRPELFGACVIDLPVLDMIRFEKFTSAAYWIQEFGASSHPEEFKMLLSYSPYHNIKAGQCYPPTLIMVGDRDQVTVPMHAYKFTAAMQAAQGCDQPVLLKMMWGAGHNFGATPEQNIDSFTDEITFLVQALHLNVLQN